MRQGGLPEERDRLVAWQVCGLVLVPIMTDDRYMTDGPAVAWRAAAVAAFNGKTALATEQASRSEVAATDLSFCHLASVICVLSPTGRQQPPYLAYVPGGYNIDSRAFPPPQAQVVLSPPTVSTLVVRFSG